TQSKGAVSFLVVHFISPGHLRGYASHSLPVPMARNGAKSPLPDSKLPLLGEGHLAMTIDPGAGRERYQGIVALRGETLIEAAQEYFDQSEQIPTFIKIAVAPHYIGANGTRSGQWAWRAGGLMVQKLAQEGGRPAGEGTPPSESEDELEGWRRAHA